MFSPKPHGFNSVEVIESSTDRFGAWMGREFPSMPIVLFKEKSKQMDGFPLLKKQNLVILVQLRSVVKVLRHSN